MQNNCSRTVLARASTQLMYLTTVIDQAWRDLLFRDPLLQLSKRSMRHLELASLRERRGTEFFGRVGWKLTVLAFVALTSPMWSQSKPAPLPSGQIIPKVICTANDKQSYALYLPKSFAANRNWPIIYVFDPGGNGAEAVEIIRAAAEKYGYIVVGSNNSKNGPQGGSSEAANAMWQDTQQRLPVDPARRYFAGMSGGARVATALALGCHGCVAGVLANAAGFPANIAPSPDMKFVYFAAVGNADMNYPEFVELRPKLDALGIHYLIRIFDGRHGWAPPEVWDEALNWMDIQAMASGLLARDPARIEETMSAELDRARGFASQGESLAALREYKAIVRNYAGLADTSVANAQVAEFQKNKEVAKQEKQEKDDIAQQNRLMAEVEPQMEDLASENSGDADVAELRNKIADLKRDVARASKQRDRLVRQRALGGLVIGASELGQRSLEQRDYRAALQYFDLAGAGASNLGWVHYERARVFAATNDKKKMMSELKLAADTGFHEPGALDASEFAAYLQDAEFQALTNQWKKIAGQ